jgi:SAM-dependent methyltransferase
MSYQDGAYWAERYDKLYYQYFRFIIRCIGPNAGSIIDVGSGKSPYLEWFDWIPRKVSIDIRAPYGSKTVTPIVGNILETDFDETFDICTCLQVLEHVREPVPFAKRLLELGHLVLISVPFRWPAGKVKGHVNDPVDLDNIISWFGRKPNYHQVVREPFNRTYGSRLFALFDVAEAAGTAGCSRLGHGGVSGLWGYLSPVNQSSTWSRSIGPCSQSIITKS